MHVLIRGGRGRTGQSPAWSWQTAVHRPQLAAQLASIKPGLDVHSPDSTHALHSSALSATSWHAPGDASFIARRSAASSAELCEWCVSLMHTLHDEGQCLSTANQKRS